MRPLPLLRLVVALPLLCWPLLGAYGGTSDHRYKDGEHVELWVNKVGSSSSLRRWLRRSLLALSIDRRFRDQTSLPVTGPKYKDSPSNPMTFCVLDLIP